MNTLYLSSSPKRKEGSALLLTLMVSSLLLVIVLGFAVFVRMQLATVRQDQQRRMAQANARLGLELSIAELQEMLGPDARSSAEVRSLTGGGLSPSVGTTHWIGAWKSPDGAEGTDHRRAHAERLTWLVSPRTGEATPPDPDTYTPALDSNGLPTGTEDALMVGPGSVGPNQQEGHVVVPLQQTDAEGRGSFGYWVADESVKALANKVEPATPDPVESRMNTQAPQGVAVDLAVKDADGNRILTGAGGLDRSDGDQLREWNRAMNPGQSGLVFASPTLNGFMKRHFHDITYRSSGLQVNARDGGLKKDLSIAFEIDDSAFHNSEFSLAMTQVDGSPDPGEWSMSNAGQSFNIKPVYSETLDPRDGEQYVRNSNSSFSLNPVSGLDSNDVFRGPTWSLLRQHYRQYLEVMSPFSDPVIAAVPATPNFRNHDTYKTIPLPGYYFDHYERSDWWDLDWIGAAEAAIRDMRGSSSRPRYATSSRMPSLLRLTTYYSVKTGDSAPSPHPVTGAPGKEVVMENNAIVTLYNPYNTKLVVPGVYLNQEQSTFALGFRLNDPIAGQPPYLEIRTDLIYQGQPHVKTRSARYDHISLALTKNGNGTSEPLVFEPGEVKVFTAAETPRPSLSSKGVIYMKEGVSGNPLDDGFELVSLIRGGWNGNESLFHSEPYYLYDGQNLKIEVKKHTYGGNPTWMPKYGNISHNEYVMLRIGLMDDDAIDRAFDNGVSKGAFDASIHWGQVLMYMPTRHMTDEPYAIYSNYGQLDGDNYYFYYLDLYRKPTVAADSLVEWTRTPMETKPHFNLRAPIQRTEYGGGFGKHGTRLPPSWDLAVPMDPTTDLGALANPNRLAFNSGTGRGYWGNTFGIRGVDQMVLYDVPTTPLLSLGALQHANIGLYVNEPEYIVGNSTAQTDLPRDNLWMRRELTHHNSGGNGRYVYWFDTSYLINEALWDGYFFSGAATPLNSAGTGFSTTLDVGDTLAGLPDGSTGLLNPQFQFELPPNTILADYQSDTSLTAYNTDESTHGDLRPHDTIAAYLRTDGSFNVNSASPEAWAALLGSQRDAILTHFSDLDTPFSTTSLNGESAFPLMTTSGSAPGGGISEFFNAFVTLSDADIELLAENIVEQIQTRIAVHGPFRSLSQFVNRWYPESTGDIDLAGVLREAIIQSGLNDTFDNEPDLADEAVYEYFRTFIDDTAYGTHPTPEGFRQSSAAGFGQYLTQGNLLTLLAPRLAVRGDTFRIRAHGRVRDPDSGAPTAQAWCEAVVERLPTYLDSETHPATPPSALTPGSLNDRFGCRFRIVSFRWLAPEEI